MLKRSVSHYSDHLSDDESAAFVNPMCAFASFKKWKKKKYLDKNSRSGHNLCARWKKDMLFLLFFVFISDYLKKVQSCCCSAK